MYVFLDLHQRFLLALVSQVELIRMWWCLTRMRSRLWQHLRVTPRRSPLLFTIHPRFVSRIRHFFISSHSPVESFVLTLVCFCFCFSLWSSLHLRTAPYVCGLSLGVTVSRWSVPTRLVSLGSLFMLLGTTCLVPLRIRCVHVCVQPDKIIKVFC